MKNTLTSLLLASLLGGAALAAAEAPTVKTPKTLLHEVARGERKLASLVARSRGVIYIAAGIEGGERSTAPVFEAKRLCGAELRRTLRGLEEHLAMTLEDDPRQGIPCSKDACVDPSSMEFDPLRLFRFAKDHEGEWRLRSVVLLDEQAPEEVSQRHEAWAERAEEALRRARCGAVYDAPQPE